MDQLSFQNPFAHLVASVLDSEGLVLIDVGAAYGIAPAWRAFGDKLRGFGFDPDPKEVDRLNAIEPAPGFKYVAGYVGLPASHPYAEKRRAKPRIARNPWYRLAIDRWMKIRDAHQHELKIPPNVPRKLPEVGDVGEKADDISSTIDLMDFCAENRLGVIDFIKVDVDGLDYDILQSLSGRLMEVGVLGIGIEINFFGSGAETCNSFHNVDRLLKSEGFELNDITIRRYPMQDLPAPSLAGLIYPASSAFGRPLQGDAFYARDICAPWAAPFAANLSPERLAKAAALYAMFGLPDCAAEILVTFRDRMEPLFDVDQGLDLLAAQAQPGVSGPLCYRDYIAAFEKDALGEYAAGYSERTSEGSPTNRRTGVNSLFHAYDERRRSICPGAECSEGPPMVIRTPSGRWHHAVEFPLIPEGLAADQRLRVAVKLDVRAGAVGVGILAKDRHLRSDEVIVSVADSPCVVELISDDVARTGPLMVRNVDPNGIASEVEIGILSIVALNQQTCQIIHHGTAGC